jgi:hypothetical protein
MPNTIYQGGSGTGLTATSYSTKTNYVGGTVPVNGDTVFIPAAAAYGITGMSATALLAAFREDERYTGAIGTATAPLSVDTDAAVLAGTGTQFIKIRNSTTVDVLECGSGSNTAYGLSLTGAGNAALRIAAGAGTVGVAANAGETGGFTATTVSTGEVTLGLGLTTSTINVDGGAVEVHCGSSTFNQFGGQVHYDEGKPVNVNLRGGTLYYSTGSTSTTVNLYAGSALDASLNMAGAVIGTLKINAPCTINDPNGRLTFTNPVEYHGINYKDVTWNRPAHFKLAYTTLA